MSDGRTPPILYGLLLLAMILGAVATAGGLDSRTGGRLVFSVALLIAQVALGAVAGVLLVRARHRT
jgi:hypothetical protein